MHSMLGKCLKYQRKKIVYIGKIDILNNSRSTSTVIGNSIRYTRIILLWLDILLKDGFCYRLLYRSSLYFCLHFYHKA